MLSLTARRERSFLRRAESVKSSNVLVVLGVMLGTAAVFSYPHIHAWLIDDGKVVVPAGRLATAWATIPKRPGDAMMEKMRVFDKLSLTGAGANFESAASDKDIFDFYTAQLRSLGWTLQPQVASRREIQFCKNGVGAIIHIDEDQRKTYYFGLVSENQRRSLNYCPASKVQ